MPQTMQSLFDALWRAFLAKVDDELKHASQEELGKRLGVNKATITKWRAGTISGTDMKSFARYMDVLGLEMSDYLRRPGRTIKSMGPLAPQAPAELLDRPDDVPPGMAVLPVHELAGAGPAWEEFETDPLFWVGVPEQYLRMARSAVQVRGDSMEPTLHDQAVVGVNREAKDIIQGKVYAVQLPYEGLVVKRVFLDHGEQKFIFRSDNKEYRDIHLAFGSAEGIIQGQVMWVLQGV